MLATFGSKEGCFECEEKRLQLGGCLRCAAWSWEGDYWLCQLPCGWGVGALQNHVFG